MNRRKVRELEVIDRFGLHKQALASAEISNFDAGEWAIESGAGTITDTGNELKISPSADGNGVCQAADPAVAPGAAVVPGQVRYFFCSDEDVRNLVSNVALCRAWALEAVGVIEGMR